MKNYLIIGGGSGIGLATAEKLQKDGHAVWATYNTSEVKAAGVNYFHLDVLSEAWDFESLPEVLDGLVYCPGKINLKPMARVKKEEFFADYEVQVWGAIRAVQELLPRLKKAENGASVVFFSTVAVKMGLGFHSIVSSSKGAIEGLTRSLAAELAPQIRVNAIAPSITLTPLAGTLLNTPEKIEANAQRHPLKKIGDVDTLAGSVLYLLSEAGSWTTGQILQIDGGMSSLRV